MLNLFPKCSLKAALLITLTLIINTINAFAQQGALDASFDPGNGFIGNVFATAIQNDGKIIVGGDFSSFNDVTRNRIARLNANGELDTSFDPGIGFNNNVYSTAIQSDGKIIVGGDFTAFNGVTRSRIARLNANGSLDNSFVPGNGFTSNVSTITIQGDGKIIVGGIFHLLTEL
jgi:uncharacterized delta-60 repeat protein